MNRLINGWGWTGTFVSSLALILTLTALPGSVAAQDEGPTAQQRQGAAEAYDRGTSAFLAGDYRQAAQWFEAANRLAPAAPALLQAIRANRQGGNLMRAASLSLLMTAEYPDNRAANRYAEEVLEEAEGQFFRVNVICDEPCRASINGSLSAHTSFFLEPGEEYTIAAGFEHGSIDQTVNGQAGEAQDIEFEAPPEPPPVELDADGVPVEEFEGLDPWVFYVTTGAAVASAGVLGWAAYEMYSGVDAYNDAADECNATNDSATCARAQELLDDGQRMEKLTLSMGIVTGVLVAGSITTGLITNWSAGDEGDAPEGDQPGVDDVQASFGATHQGGGVMIRGSF